MDRRRALVESIVAPIRASDRRKDRFREELLAHLESAQGDEPSPDAAIERLGVRADEALFVGDTYELDVVGATAAGLAAAWYTRGRAADRETSHPVIADLADLNRLL